MLETLEDRVRRQELDAGRRELDGERHPMQARGDAGHGRSVVVRHLEVRSDTDSAGDEQPNRLVLRRGGGIEAPIAGWQVHLLEVGERQDVTRRGQARNRVLLFAADPERSPARHDGR